MVPLTIGQRVLPLQGHIESPNLDARETRF